MYQTVSKFAMLQLARLKRETPCMITFSALHRFVDKHELCLYTLDVEKRLLSSVANSNVNTEIAGIFTETAQRLEHMADNHS